MKILIAEDDPISRKLLEATLKKRNFDVDVTEDGEQAWEILKDGKAPQLAILDWMMPGMDGLDVCRMVREKKAFPYTYIILLTAKGRKEDIAQGLQEGADDYVTKPFNPQELMARVKVGIRMIDLHNTLNRHVERYRDLDRLKSRFLSTVSHEFKTPLAVIKGGISLIMDGVVGETNPRQKEVLQDTLENIDRLNRMITDLLNVSRMEAGRVRLKKKRIELTHLIRKLGDGFESRFREKGVSLHYGYPDNGVGLYADPDKIIQVFTNLISNALRFTPPGGRVKIGVEEDADRVVCIVEDTGTGIDPQNIPHLFTPFTQFGKDEDEREGTGLGLAIVKGIVENHGGEVDVRSVPGEGAAFRFTLEKKPRPLILVVDDNALLAERICGILGEKEYRFSEAHESADVFKKALDEQPALIILDLTLRKMNSFQLIQNLKVNGDTGRIPVLGLSNREIAEEEWRTKGVTERIPVFTMPLEPERFTEKVRMVLEPVTVSVQ
jgi:signal transduction histidine kinase